MAPRGAGGTGGTVGCMPDERADTAGGGDDWCKESGARAGSDSGGVTASGGSPAAACADCPAAGADCPAACADCPAAGAGCPAACAGWAPPVRQASPAGTSPAPGGWKAVGSPAGVARWRGRRGPRSGRRSSPGAAARSRSGIAVSPGRHAGPAAALGKPSLAGATDAVFAGGTGAASSAGSPAAGPSRVAAKTAYRDVAASGRSPDCAAGWLCDGADE